ncbi:MAG: alpha/beta hydrolase family protein [Gammaproteobacteria bacterium]
MILGLLNWNSLERDLAYVNQVDSDSQNLRVYIEGDGLPWFTRYLKASDPTPKNPLMLSLMSRDTTRSMYLGRPCYFGKAHDKGCSHLIWTEARYSEKVVDSMAHAINNYVYDKGIRHLQFIGHSGGGTLAMLLAERFENTNLVVTLAGNLDIDAWTRYHHYSPLYLSLNPADQAPLSKSVRQIHYAGINDTVVPPEIIDSAIKNQPTATYILLDQQDHSCCWNNVWPNILIYINQL